MLKFIALTLFTLCITIIPSPSKAAFINLSEIGATATASGSLYDYTNPEKAID
jgi:hypothetical protein